MFLTARITSIRQGPALRSPIIDINRGKTIFEVVGVLLVVLLIVVTVSGQEVAHSPGFDSCLGKNSRESVDETVRDRKLAVDLLKTSANVLPNDCYYRVMHGHTASTPNPPTIGSAL